MYPDWNTTKKNENVFISLQIQKDMESKKLLLRVHFDKKARNFSITNETIVWCPTCDEIDFITEVSELIRGGKYPEKVIETSQTSITPSEEATSDYSHDSSEIGIAPIENDRTIEVTADLESSSITNKGNVEKIFFQIDEKKIDEVLNRKKQVVEEDYAVKSGKKVFIDRMLKQKKKKIDNTNIFSIIL
jgi:hypothetical protein